VLVRAPDARPKVGAKSPRLYMPPVGLGSGLSPYGRDPDGRVWEERLCPREDRWERRTRREMQRTEPSFCFARSSNMRCPSKRLTAPYSGPGPKLMLHQNCASRQKWPRLVNHSKSTREQPAPLPEGRRAVNWVGRTVSCTIVSANSGQRFTCHGTHRVSTR